MVGFGIVERCYIALLWSRVCFLHVPYNVSSYPSKAKRWIFVLFSSISLPEGAVNFYLNSSDLETHSNRFWFMYVRTCRKLRWGAVCESTELSAVGPEYRYDFIQRKVLYSTVCSNLPCDRARYPVQLVTMTVLPWIGVSSRAGRHQRRVAARRTLHTVLVRTNNAGNKSESSEKRIFKIHSKHKEQTSTFTQVQPK